MAIDSKGQVTTTGLMGGSPTSTRAGTNSSTRASS